MESGNSRTIRALAVQGVVMTAWTGPADSSGPKRKENWPDFGSSLTAGSRTAPKRHRSIGATVDWSYQLLDPDTGMLAAGEGSGPGRMPEPEMIAAHVARMLDAGSLRGRSVLVTAGPTRCAQPQNRR